MLHANLTSFHVSIKIMLKFPKINLIIKTSSAKEEQTEANKLNINHDRRDSPHHSSNPHQDYVIIFCVMFILVGLIGGILIGNYFSNKNKIK